MKPLISILIPSLPERLPKLNELLDCIPSTNPDVEVIVLMDNRRRQVGAKRNAMMAMAQGLYVAHIDDDELLSPDYFERVLPELTYMVDVVAYDAGVSFNGSPEFRVITKLGADIGQPQDLGNGTYSDTVRPPWHWCAWRTDFARRFTFPEDYGWTEDWGWLSQALPQVKTWRRIDWIGFHHRWSAETTEFKKE